VIGHTANSEAKVRCAEVVDQHLGLVIEAAKKNNYVVIITADHGNIEELFTRDGKPHVAHTTNLVPFIVIDPLVETPIKSSDGSLMDIAPTILEILKVEIPEVMTGRNLVKDHDFGLERDVILIILDGWGNGLPNDTNPIYIGKTPYWDMLQKKYLPSQLKASGEAVGLQLGKAGNSEAGHMNIGAGRIVLQDDVRLDNAMQDGTFFTNIVFLQSIESVLQKKSNLHLIGLLTEKSSHGSIDYPLALLKMAKQKGVKEVYLHLIFDGRSTEPGSAPVLLEKLEKSISDIGVGQVVSGIGRGIVLDRDGNFAKIKKAYDAMVYGIGSTFT
jgi:2,3-bisphosphoglycerate-independent phosphoglycerate mutase